MKKNILEEGVRYIIVGVLTTAVNYIFYAGGDFLFERMGIPSVFSYKIAYLIAFIMAVLFAYFTNKYLVFRKSGGNKGKELFSFFSLRIASGILSFLLLMFFVDFLHFTHTPGWILSSGINLVLNYIGSKFFIFR